MAELIGIKEASEILGLSHATVWRWAKDGKLQAVTMVGKQALFSREYIQREAQRRSSQKPAQETAHAS